MVRRGSDQQSERPRTIARARDCGGQTRRAGARRRDHAATLTGWWFVDSGWWIVARSELRARSVSFVVVAMMAMPGAPALIAQTPSSAATSAGNTEKGRQTFAKV